MNKRWVALLLVAIVAAGLAARLVPFASSPYPYNVDGYPLVKGAERVAEFGYWEPGENASFLEGYNSKMPVFSYVLAEFSLVSGIPPMESIQLVTALLGSVCILLGYALAKRLTGSDLAGLGCAAFLSLQGFFVYATVAAWKEGLGIVLMLLAFLLFEGRADPRKRLMLVLVMLLLPMTHHLTTLVVYTFVFTAACAEAVSRWREDRLGWEWTGREATTVAAPAAFAYLYYISVDMEFFSEANNLNDVALLASAVSLGVVVAIVLALPAMSKPWFFFDSKPGKPSVALLFDEKSLALLIGYGALWANSRMQLFPGTHFTSRELLIGIAPLIPVYLLAIAGFNLIRYSRNNSKITLSAMAITPLFLMVFALSKSYDPASFFIAYRLLDYIDPFVAVCAGIGLAFLVAKSLKRFGKVSRRGWGAAIAFGSVFVILVASTTPLAYDWERVFDISSETKPQQYGAIEWAQEAGVARISTDQWNADIADPYFEIRSDQLLPYHLRDGKGYGDAPLLLEDEWKARGAQTYLSGRVSILGTNFDRIVEDRNLVYSAGLEGQRVLIVIPSGG
ncbi:MAG: hypothetical protein V1934_06770 [Methanobacteriota archaeon]